jgi:hypothetical protein
LEITPVLAIRKRPRCYGASENTLPRTDCTPQRLSCTVPRLLSRTLERMLRLFVKVTSSPLWYPSPYDHRSGGRHELRAEGDLVKSVSTSRNARLTYITVTVARLSQILAALFQVLSTARKNQGGVVLYSSNPALAGLKERL